MHLTSVMLWRTTIILLILGKSFCCFGQTEKVLNPLWKKNANKAFPNLQQRTILPIFSLALPAQKASLSAGITVPDDANSRHLPFFCAQENRMDKKLPIALRLRVGSFQQCDWLERKPAATRPE
jgi:hypothetical protein